MNIKGICTVESDGFHLHEYWSGGFKVTEHLHTWIEEHLKQWPGSSRVYVGERAYPGTASEAWAQTTGKPLPAVECKAAS